MTEIMNPTITLQHVNRLQQLYQAGFQDTFLDTALSKIIGHQIQRDEADLREIETILSEFESQYGLTSSDFWQRYQAGQMDDTLDFMEWHVHCQARQRLQARLHILKVSA